nr:PDZ and LIM domain protein 2 [Pelodiscus sinensis]|eukprot:XP_006135618.1 PDZ and LIM domain protein 2 [Pelodiscus sinensis]
MSVAVNLTGPAPWGFRITGGRDFRKPIIVSKVIEHGKAAAGDLRLGDVITSINGESTAGMLNVEAQNKIKQSSGQLQLQVASCHPSSSPVTVLPLINRTPSPHGSWEMGRAPGRASPSYSPRSSLDSESAMRRLEEDSEVYKMMQENREVRAAPRQSSTFRMLQVALESDGRDGTTAPFPSQLSPSAHKPVASSVAQKLHVCEKCDTSIRARPRHSSCYVCTDCGLNLRLGGHFWVGEELFCEKHARQRYQGLGKGAAATAVASES